MSKTVKQSISRSYLTRQILIQYFMCLIAFWALYAFLVIGSWFIYAQFTWEEHDLIYQLVQIIKRYFLLFLIIPALLGWIVITYIFMAKPLGYLDQIVAASAQLAPPTQNPILLPEPLKNIQDELNSLREQALRNAQIAKEAEQRKNDMIVYLAHDLKTPLTSVIGYLTLLYEEPSIPEDFRLKYTGIALNKADRLEELINEFFDITRFNLSNIPLELSRVNVTRMLEQVLFEFKPLFQEKNITYTLQGDSELMLECDSNKMQRVFDNLLRNAVNYSFENSCLRVTVIQSATQVHISFTNQGNTISPEKLNHLFEQFYRLDSSRASKSGGAGLGLAIAKEIVQQHQGTITAKSEDDLITFLITLPIS